MPILDKMNQNHPPEDNNGHQPGDDEPLFDYPKPEPVQRRRPQPEFLDARLGRAAITVSALVERIVDAVTAEHTPDDSAIRAAKTRADRLKLLRPVVDYVLSVESVEANNDQTAELMRLAYSDLFGLGPLDALIDDPAITTISLEGANKVSVRRGHGEMMPLDILFEDISHFKDVVGRLLQRADATLTDENPLIEVGFQAENGRFISVNLAAPPVTVALSLDIRLHPVEGPTLEGLVARGTLDARGARVLRALMASDYGFVLAGQPEAGKTMTLSGLLTALPDPARAAALERTGELHLPEGMTRILPDWSGMPGVTFGEQVAAHHDGGYRTLVLDEVRADEPHTIAPLLTAADPPRMIWSMRGSPAAKRLRAALDMLARRADMANGDQLSDRLFERMPFVVSVRRLDGVIQLREVGEWVRGEGGYWGYQPLMQQTMGEMLLMETVPEHRLAGIEDDFWTE
jgi:type IV secretory pathway ATPase VirB11/archaellum biosynthesis ATPase